ncbi:MAG: ThiF family adenylyltransferase [Chloroflexi bacterium]|nr:ThiF family adenylyltransferase [Chloroflexota bacterium]
MDNERYDRNIRFFGKEGQERLGAAKVAVVGIGGLGTHVVQQLALLGVGQLVLIDPQDLDRTNFNRYIGVSYDDPVPGTLKVDIGSRIVKKMNPETRVVRIPDSLLSQRAFKAVIASDYIFGCLDREGARLILNELCSAYSKPYFDLASEIFSGNPPQYGGRLCVAWDGRGCIVCYRELDVAEAQTDLMNPKVRQDRDTIYGVPRELLGEAGPSVVSINGVIASLAVTEFMLLVTGVRTIPKRLITYRAHTGGVSVKTDDPEPDCYYCVGLRGKGDAADVQRYLRSGISL